MRPIRHTRYSIKHPVHTLRLEPDLNVVVLVALLLCWFVFQGGLLASTGPRLAEPEDGSEEALELADLIVHGLETFQPKPLLQSLARQMLALDPDSALGYYLMSEVQNTPGQAEGFLRQAYVLSLSADPDLDSRFFKAQYLKSPQPEIAIRTLESLLSEQPALRPAWMTLGRLFLDQGNVDQAEASLRRALSLDDGTARVHALLAECAFLRGDFQGSRERYEKALLLKNPQAASHNLYKGIALTHLSQNRTEDAIAALERSLTGLDQETRQPGSDLIFGISRQPSTPRRTLFDRDRLRNLLRTIRIRR